MTLPGVGGAMLGKLKARDSLHEVTSHQQESQRDDSVHTSADRSCRPLRTFSTAQLLTPARTAFTGLLKSWRAEQLKPAGAQPGRLVLRHRRVP